MYFSNQYTVYNNYLRTFVTTASLAIISRIVYHTPKMEKVTYTYVLPYCNCSINVNSFYRDMDIFKSNSTAHVKVNNQMYITPGLWQFKSLC